MLIIGNTVGCSVLVLFRGEVKQNTDKQTKLIMSSIQDTTEIFGRMKFNNTYLDHFNSKEIPKGIEALLNSRR